MAKKEYRTDFYNNREQDILNNPDRIVARIFLKNRWQEKSFFPKEGQTVRELLEELQIDIHNMNEKRVTLHVGGHDPKGDYRIVFMPLDRIPDELKG